MNISTGTLETGYAYRLQTPDKDYMPFYNVTIDLPHDVPNFFIDCKLNDLEPKNLIHAFSDKQRITVEGSFPAFYDTYSSEVERLNFLSLLTPNIMYTIMKLGLICDIEFVDKRLQLYWPMTDQAADPTSDIIHAATELTKQLDRLLRRYDTIADLKPNDPGIIAAIEKGTRLKDATLEVKLPRNEVEFASMVRWILIGILTLVLSIFIISAGSNEFSIEDLGGFVVISVAVAFVIAGIIIGLPYALFVRKRVAKKYKQNLRVQFGIARKNLS